jgi:hypothetical protein
LVLLSLLSWSFISFVFIFLFSSIIFLINVPTHTGAHSESEGFMVAETIFVGCSFCLKLKIPRTRCPYQAVWVMALTDAQLWLGKWGVYCEEGYYNSLFKFCVR